jgi:hypothetical protein
LQQGLLNMRKPLFVLITLLVFWSSCERNPEPFTGFSTNELSQILIFDGTNAKDWRLTTRSISGEESTDCTEALNFYFFPELDSFSEGNNLFIQVIDESCSSDDFCELYPLFCRENTDYCEEYPERCIWLFENFGPNFIYVGNWAPLANDPLAKGGVNGLKVYAAGDSIEYSISTIKQNSLVWTFTDQSSAEEVTERFTHQ